MKRSEMVDLITIEFNLADGMADEILALMESRGMRPPTVDVLDSPLGYNYSYNQWEPEDEKK